MEVIIFIKSLFLLVILSQTTWSSDIHSSEELQIVGGHDINITEAPYQVSISLEGFGLYCGGIIVAKDVILTAAHCVEGLKPDVFHIRAGSSLVDSGGEVYQVQKIIQHEEFSIIAKYDKDVAVMKLSKDLLFNDKIKPISMMEKDTKIEEGKLTHVTGWGRVQENGEISKILQMVEVPIVSQELCQKEYPSMNITTSMLCAGLAAGGKDSCGGDSGGPLVYDNKVAGIVSWGKGCARPHLPGVYANVSDLRPWIDQAIAKLRQKDFLRAASKFQDINSSQELRIVGGHDINITEAPYQVSISIEGFGFFCGGIIVAKDVILTAAQCVDGLNPDVLRIRAGASLVDSGGEVYQVQKIIQHEEYSVATLDKDVAVMKLSKDLLFNDKIKPISMMEKDTKIEEGKQTNVTGWGYVKEHGEISKILQMVEVPIVSQELCQKEYPSKNITTSMLCAGLAAGGKDSCVGDAGGPLVYDNKVAGIVSWGSGCARPHLPGVYANVADLRPWIDQAISKLRQKDILRSITEPKH